jgi:hypothetical protein
LFFLKYSIKFEVSLAFIVGEITATYWNHYRNGQKNPTTPLYIAGAHFGNVDTCLKTRNNYFDSKGRDYKITVEGNVQVCLVIFCLDLANGFLWPWRATRN